MAKPHRSLLRQYYDILNSLRDKSALLISEVERIANLGHYPAIDCIKILEGGECVEVTRTESNVSIKITVKGLEFLHLLEDFEKKIQAMNLDIKL